MHGPLPAVVLDCGTGYTKMGFAGNVEVCHCALQTHKYNLRDDQLTVYLQ